MADGGWADSSEIGDAAVSVLNMGLSGTHCTSLAMTIIILSFNVKIFM